MTTEYKLGLNDSPDEAFPLKLGSYLKTSALPKIPGSFGHEQLIADWGMLGNDEVGDCVIAGSDHEAMLWNAAAGNPIPEFTTETALADYSAITGFNPADPTSDQGTDMATAAEYRKNTGMIDAAGNRHKIAAYLELEPGNLNELAAATYLFGAVGIGITVTDIAQEQFAAGKPWSFRLGGDVMGGHYVPVVARRNGYFVVVTWGKLQKMTWAFYVQQSMRAIAYVSDEYLHNGESPEHFDKAALLRDLAAL
ncbi:hypothetical protein [Nocardia jiangxiensis]|uniref:hypothetical protein n=1 Tax=Nocardia jiangxiensis TaxID=282685 RepID=UPI0002FA5C81|nr:hypothetical protein [Nocardia jiangxiensis]